MMQTMQNIITKFDDPIEFAEVLKNKRIGLYNLGPGIGDNVYHAYFPEIYYRNVGRKVVDIKNSWVFDYNPYVERNSSYDVAICPWGLNDGIKNEQRRSAPEHIFGPLQFKIDLRHPRLYKFEDIEKIPRSICVHTTGRSSRFSMPDKVIDAIAKKYKDYTIFQVGKNTDKDTPFIDKRNLTSIWDTVELIAKCEMFIGVNSGLYHIANCYPSVIKKIVMADTLHSEHDLENWMPMHNDFRDGFWSDISTLYYNLSEHDIGVTYSYKKI